MGMDPFPDLGVKKFIALLDGKEKSYVTVKALPFSHDFIHFSSYKSNIVWIELLFGFAFLNWIRLFLMESKYFYELEKSAV